jgi:hypothetical protein
MIPFFAPGEPLPASKLQLLNLIDETYVPTLDAATTAPNLGTSPTQLGLVHLNGNRVSIWWRIVWGTSPSAGSGRYGLVLPAEYPLHASTPTDVAIGGVNLVDSNTATVRTAQAHADVTEQQAWFRVHDGNTVVTNSSPWTWAAGDVMAGWLDYLTDFD